MYKFFEKTMVQTDSANLLQSDDNNLPSTEIYDNISRFIENFEEKERKRKELKNEKKLAMEEKKEEIKGLGRFFIDAEEKEDKPTTEPESTG